MNRAELEALRREEFPITRSGIYLDHATLGPPPACHVRAVTDLLGRVSMQGLPDLFSIAGEGLDRVRAKAALLLGSDAESIAIIPSTSHGVNLVAEGLEWREGDEVIAYELDHAAGVLPWLGLHDRGVRVRFVRDRGRYGFDPEDVVALMGPRTRVVSLSLVNFGHGARADLEAVGRLSQERGIWFVVDAAQALGALALDAGSLGADVIAAQAYKFLLSGFGVGLCHCSGRALRELRVTGLGWKSVRDAFAADRILDYRLEHAPGARRFEPSFPPLPQVFGLEAVLDLFARVGLAEVELMTLAIVRRLIEGLLERGYEVVGRQAEAAQSPIVSVRITEPGHRRRFRDACSRLTVAYAVREERVRLSPHFYTATEEVDALLREL